MTKRLIGELYPDLLEIENYYDLSLIINIISRDHVSTNNQFLHTYTKSLLSNGFTEDDITSSGYLFSMLCFFKTGNINLLLNKTKNDYFDTSRFLEDLSDEIKKEETFFLKHSVPLSKEKIEELIQHNNDYNYESKIEFVLENLFIHKDHQASFPELVKCITKYLYSEEVDAFNILESFLSKYNKNALPLLILKNAKRNILALGYISEINDYKNLSLKEFISKYSNLGSFDLWVEVLNYLRLALHLNRDIDFFSISKFWTKYYQRKDYSLISVPQALTVFEKEGILTEVNSINLINSIQKMSEKGYGGVLNEYVKLHSEKIIISISNNFDIEKLSIFWFALPTKFIDKISDKIFNISVRDLLSSNRYDKQIPFREIINVVRSNRCKELRNIIEVSGYVVSIPSGKSTKLLKDNNIRFIKYFDKTNSYNQNSETHFSNGILTIQDKKLILEKKLKPDEIAGFSNGNYSALSDLNLYKLFPKDDIRENIKAILFNALLGKINSINSYHTIYYLPGNLLQLVRYYKIRSDFEPFFRSFQVFMELSMFNINSSKASNLPANDQN